MKWQYFSYLYFFLCTYTQISCGAENQLADELWDGFHSAWDEVAHDIYYWNTSFSSHQGICPDPVAIERLNLVLSLLPCEEIEESTSKPPFTLLDRQCDNSTLVQLDHLAQLPQSPCTCLLCADCLESPFSRADDYLHYRPLNEFNAMYPDERHYNEVCWLTAHNAFANAADGWVYAQQRLSLEDQFEYGVRSFMVDLHWEIDSSGIERVALCHEGIRIKQIASSLGIPSCYTSSALRVFKYHDPAIHFFEHVRKWLDKDPSAIITIHIESHLDEGRASAALSSILEETGLLSFIYEPYMCDYWPTLGELRKINKRLILFSDNPADGSIFVNHYLETEYNLSRYASCEMREEQRAPSGSQRRLFLLNHFYSLSALADYEAVNAVNNIINRMEQCYQQQKRLPNFIAVDFVEQGQEGGARELISQLNRLPAEFFHDYQKIDWPLFSNESKHNLPPLETH